MDGAGDEHAVMTPMWRGVVLFRVVALGVALINLVRFFDGYRLPGLAVAVVAGMAAWTLFSSLWFLRRGDSTVAVADLVVIPLATLSTLLVDDPARIAAGGAVLTTVWSAGAVLSMAVATGWRGGLLASVITVGVLAAVRRTVDSPFVYDTQLLIVVGLAVGLSADMMRVSARRLRTAIAAEAAIAERERLARSIHDEVLQVLAFVRRRGDEVARAEPHGTAADLALLAGEQEVALRRLIATGPASGPGARAGADDEVDLSTVLAGVLPTRASLATPARAVLVDRLVADGLSAVVREAAANAAAHAGPDAGLWVLVEDGDGEVVVSVRDDGPGIPEGRLEEARAQGHLGVASSMRGRVGDLGGTVDLHTGAEEGTEWEIRVPRRAGRPADVKGSR